jgi:PAS domain S-box-containing protein
VSTPIQVLLVEDLEQDAALLLRELRHGGYEPTCERVETAAAMASALDRQPWDVVIADYMLPGFSGPAALKLLQRRNLDLPFIIVSGHIDEDTAVASMKAGAHDYVMKDRLTRLVPAIEREMAEAEVRRARHRSEEQFAREQAFRQAIENSIPSGIAVVNAEGRQTYVNSAFCEMVGWSGAELLGAKAPFVYWPADEAEGLTQAFEAALHGQAPTSSHGVEARFQHRKGPIFDVLMLSRPMHDSRGKVAGWLASVTDITERKRAERRLVAQYAVASVVSEAENLSAAAPEILQIIGEGFGWDCGGLWRAEPGSKELHCLHFWHRLSAPMGRFEAVSRNRNLPAGVGLPGRILASGQPCWLSDLATADSFPRRAEAAGEGLRSGCGVPIQLGEEVLGALEFFSREPREPDRAHLQWLGSIGSQVGQFMERAMAQAALRRAHDELERRVQERTADLMAANTSLEASIRERRRLENELLEITEKERRRIGLDLHDDLGQKLAGLTLMMKGLELGLMRKKLPEAADAQKISALIGQTVTHANGLARDLALAELEGTDLSRALGELAANVRNLFSISCEFKSVGRIPSLESNVVTQLYKITQEAVTNAVKHGKAKQVGIDLVKKPAELVLTVRNNGLTFPALIDKSKGMGLRIMNYRANLIGASLEIKPGRPKGAVVTCSLAFPRLHANNDSKDRQHASPTRRAADPFVD